MKRAVLCASAAAITFLVSDGARADDETAPTEPPAEELPPSLSPPGTPRMRRPPPPPPIPIEAVESEDRAKNVEPKAAVEPPAKISFAADPIADGGIIIASLTFAGLLEQINGTGEIRPQQIVPGFERSQLLWIDRFAVSQTVDDSAKLRSNIGLFSAVGFAALDPVLTGFRERHAQAALVDAIIYAEALTVTMGVTNLAKIAVRRPRPIAYIEAEKHKDDPTWSSSNTDSALSFFSGHASITATVAATSSYLAFARSPNLWRPLVTLAVGTTATVFTSYERVRGGAHFPTDVIAGAVAGAGIGVIVAHLHRSEDVKQRRIWVGFAPEKNDGGVVQLGGVF
jgi:membrane-associated phospholipid phosphatase